jgi:hypothetical protein
MPDATDRRVFRADRRSRSSLLLLALSRRWRLAVFIAIDQRDAEYGGRRLLQRDRIAMGVGRTIL